MSKKISFPSSRRGELVIIPTYPWTCRICHTYDCKFPCPFWTEKGYFDWEGYWNWWFDTVPSYDWKKRLYNQYGNT